ncbi:CBS domain-containing protein [Chitinophaga filiformis]|uniref:CBS domain-containing protein n=1 Tax=Chitinophaga filiformis TaxID=104663 RepID=A0ABY4HW80_CHIFI|nr:CBS domain-containing protein [Chitinophaga filiformis]UPK67708.1 CBS domain-containing protein [Chitinophaga filiformis]
MGTVRDILRVKGHVVYSIQPNDTVFDALSVLVNKNVGALVVLSENDKVVGIFSERDYARRVILKGRASKETLISEIMTENPFTVSEDDSIQDCMVKMTDKHIRHLPVTDDQQRLVGMISIGDVVKYVIGEQQFIIDNLEGYIKGTR